MRSISGKLALLQAVCALLVVVVLYWVLDRQLSMQMRANFTAHADVIATALAKSIEPALIDRDITSAQSALDAVLSVPGVRWAYIAGPDGKVVAHTFVPQFPPGLEGQLAEAADVTRLSLAGQPGFALVVRKGILAGIVGNVYVGFPLGVLEASIRSMEGVVLLSILVVMMIVSVIVALVTEGIIRPIRHLTAAARQLSQGAANVFRPLQVRSRDEIGVLTATFNSMAAQVYQQHETLEMRVKERTEALTLANAGLAAEIVEREQAQKAVKESAELIRLLLEGAPEAIYGIDMNGNATFCNAACLRLLGYGTPAELLGRNMHELTRRKRPEGTHDPFEESSVALALRTGSDTHVDAGALWRKDGTSFPIECWSKSIRRADTVIGAVVTFIDVTERRQAEEVLRKAKVAAEEGSRTKSEFLANMSHEIRTPLNGVIGMTDLVLGTELTAEQREFLETVKLSADSLLGVINDVLDFSKMEAGKIDLDLIEFDLREHLEVTLRTHALRADQKGLELICEVPPGLRKYVNGDPNRLRQVLNNLVGNAIKFTDSGEVVVKIEAMHGKDADPLLHFTVADTGIGVLPEKQQRIFEPFTQADNSTTRTYGGTGLGLAISKRLIDLMGGQIWLESDLGAGSRFHFTASLPTAERSTAQEASAPPDVPPGVRVLVVDDNPTNRRVIVENLRAWGIHADGVESGALALGSLADARREGHTFHGVLVDAHMPQLDGFDLIREIRRQHDPAPATIIMLTPSGFAGDTARCINLGIPTYVTKPIRQAELRAAIARSFPSGHADPTGSGRTPFSGQLPVRQNALRVLVVEDNPVNQLLMTRLLTKLGHSVKLAGNGRIALEAIEAQDFDLILMDVSMPEMDGIEATQILREREAMNGIHRIVIGVTAHAMAGDRERFLQAGMDDYLSKPIRPNELAALLESIKISRWQMAG